MEHKTYQLLPIENGYVAYQEGEIKNTNQYAICLSEIEKHPEDAIIKPQIGCNSVGECVACRKIIAHTGIPSLKDSGLALIENEKVWAFTGWMGGYKAAGGYTEEDIRKAFFNGGINLASDEDDEKQFKDFLKSLKKHPKAVVLECEPEHEALFTGDFPTGKYIPKIVEGKVIVKEVIYE